MKIYQLSQMLLVGDMDGQTDKQHGDLIILPFLI
jgi:hypothetical protein